MKRLFVICLLLLISCNNENASDCFQTAGTLVKEIREVPVFDKILVLEGVTLVIKMGDEHKVEVESGKNLINDISVEVEEGKLILADHNSCNYVRDYDKTKIYVTVPDLKEIRNASQFTVYSDGVWEYSNLLLISEQYSTGNYQSVGDFDIDVNMETLRLNFSNLSNCYARGHVQNLELRYTAGNGRFEGAELIAENVSVYHRGTNDVLVNPVQSLKGQIISYGDVRSFNKPPIVEVEEVFKGRLIFED
ncbi:head GIN domain-containing protein [Zhouia amylolytica]|uniref:head GIN domain-containing protein n=1 Tax=Zhouia amylolytica TaxID=376730 RepID=UPI0020CF566D|nr:head GIN domain-containing protein [Zhouia amylolytica]MCQ0110612.1 DUF2807 domain-containing protein [Zhouia amylolytica]